MCQTKFNNFPEGYVFLFLVKMHMPVFPYSLGKMNFVWRQLGLCVFHASASVGAFFVFYAVNSILKLHAKKQLALITFKRKEVDFMTVFQINFLRKMKILLGEAFSFKKYKAMGPAMAVFTGILMIPFVLISFFLIVVLSVFSFNFAVVSSPVKYLHELVHSEGSGVRHATQTVIYLVSWPVVFFLYLLMSVSLISILPVYAALSVSCYIWSLGGFKFHLFPDEADDICIDVCGEYRLLHIFFVLIGFTIVVLLPVIHAVILYNELYRSYMEVLFIPIFFSSIYVRYIFANIVFTALYSIIGFARYPKPESIPEQSSDE